MYTYLYMYTCRKHITIDGDSVLKIKADIDIYVNTEIHMDMHLNIDKQINIDMYIHINTTKIHLNMAMLAVFSCLLGSCSKRP